ncbi:MAG TPA: hypothetical protein VMR25_08960 [Planctomycetaceae bacterium]|jgi:hypothetical protein|nr:hypothetical protein [Planctomycetaceae bacterium]
MATTVSSAGYAAPPKPRVEGIRVGTVDTEIRTVATVADGLPSDEVLSVAVLATGEVYAGTSGGLVRFGGHKWAAIPSVTRPVKLLAPQAAGVFGTSGDQLCLVRGDSNQSVAALPQTAHLVDELRSLAVAEGAGGRTVLLGTRSGLFELGKAGFVLVEPLNTLLGSDKDVRQVGIAADGRVAVAASAGLFVRQKTGEWERPNPVDGSQSWWPRDVRGTAFDSAGRLWFASPAGVGRFDGDKWSLYTGEKGLPSSDFTTLAAGPGGTVWFGTRIGAIRFDGHVWNYRQGRRWLPDDKVHSVAISTQGDAWFATAHGLGRIERRAMTLAEKAAVFETMIDKYHRRTPYGYVDGVDLAKPGDLSHWTQHDDDNDGLWTGMYGAGECFAYAATHDPVAKMRARAAFEALRFLSQVTQGGTHPAPKGFPARSILPTSGPDPNRNETPERDRRQLQRDPRWKRIALRWPKSADGKWYWKCDTSSDELDGHFFLYACYYDLVAETEAERQPVREVVTAIIDHLLTHDFNLVDHDGKPTRWARFGPSTLNDPGWIEERGLNSLSILSYLAVAEHVTGEKRFRDALVHLVKDYAYLSNLAGVKVHFGPGTGNQSDDEMAFMCYFNLLKYATDLDVRRAVNTSLRRYWVTEEPEDSPLFNFIFAASYEGSGRFEPAAPATSLADALDFLKRYPLDRCEWAFTNSHRLDVVRFARTPGRYYRTPRGELRTRTAVPIDERFINHWNYDAWTLDGRGTGRVLADGTSYLLPYYLGRYFGFIVEATPAQNGVSPKLSRTK